MTYLSMSVYIADVSAHKIISTENVNNSRGRWMCVCGVCVLVWGVREGWALYIYVLAVGLQLICTEAS